MNQKQIIYPTFSSRIFAGILDLCLISFIAGPLLSYLHNQMIITEFADYFHRMQLDVSDPTTLISALKTKEFIAFMSDEGYYSSVKIGLTSLFLQLFCIALYNILSIYKFGTSFGKFIIRSKVVDMSSLQKPNLTQLIKRCVLALLAFIGFWSILFSSKRQSFHDKIAKTIVIKV
jgi:uncharacterized RDD family membrane protein YckC